MDKKHTMQLSEIINNDIETFIADNQIAEEDAQGWLVNVGIWIVAESLSKMGESDKRELANRLKAYCQQLG